MPKNCENWLGFLNCCVYYARKTREINKILIYSVDSKAPAELWNPMSKTILSKCSLIRIKDL